MIIENSDALKSWLTSCLEHMCDADPAALAKYVMALVKKDKTEKELKDICLDQLDVFLQKETKPFVDMLFETLSSKSYLQGKPSLPPRLGAVVPAVAPVIPAIPQQQPPVTMPATVAIAAPPQLLVVPAHKESATGLAASALPRVAAMAATAAAEASLPVVAPAQQGKAPGVTGVRKDEVATAEEEREPSRTSHRKSKSRSRSPVGGRSRNRSREDERRSGRRFGDERRRRTSERRRHEAGGRHRGDGARNRWGPEERPGRSAGPRDRSHSGRRSRSVSRSRSRSRSPRSRNRSRDGAQQRAEARNSGGASEARGPEGSHGDTDYRPGQPPPPPPNAAPAEGQQAPSGFHAKASKRCRDYDERGYCMRGDYCPFDHGNDPLIVEDVSVLRFGLSGPPPPPPPPPPAPALPPQPSLPQGVPPSLAQLTQVLPPMAGSQESQALAAAEPYNPEAPGMERPLRVPQGPPPFWGPPPRPGAPPPPFHPQRPSHRELIPVGPPPADLSQPPPPTPGRTVIDPRGPPLGPPPPGMSPADGVAEGSNGAGVLGGTPGVPPTAPVLPGVPTQGMVGMGGPPPPLHHQGPPPPMRQGRGCPGPWERGPRPPMPNWGPHGMGRGRPDYGRNRAASHYDRCELEVRKVPRNLNTITELNNYFSRFGNIVNLQVCYEGDPEAALIRFATHGEANAAYRCTEAVLNNRFIKLFWHNKDRANSNNSAGGSNAPAINGSAATHDGAAAGSNGGAAAATLPPNGSSAVAETLPSKNVKERLGTPLVEKSAVFAAGAGNLSRTVFNPAALKKNNVINTGLPKRTKEEQKKEVIKKKVEVQGQRQRLLEKHLQQNKVLVEKLQKCKTDKEREEIKQTLANLDAVIQKLRTDFKTATNELISSRGGRGAVAAAPAAAFKADVPQGAAGRTQAEKELLDAEMDLYNKVHRGDDTTDLRKRVQELRHQARAMGLVSQWKGGRGGFASRRGASRGGGRGGAGAVRRGLNTVDHRPRKVFVQGMDEGDKENLQAHFAQYGEVEGVEHLNTGLVITFKTRKDAELGVSRGSEFKNRPLQWAWFKEQSRTPSAGDSASAPSLAHDDLVADDESTLALEEDLLLVDDEEEEDSEARSWRR